MTNAEIINQNSFLRLKSKNIRRTVARRIFYIIITAVLCLLFAVICAALFFKIQTVEVTGNSIYGADELVSISGIETGQNLYAVSGGKVAAQIMRACTYVKSVKLHRNLPSTLVIEVEEDTASYYIYLAGEYFSLSSDLRVLGRSDSADKLIADNPGIKYIAVPEPSYCVVGSTIQFKHGTNLKFVTGLMADIELWDMYDTIDYIDMSDKFNVWLVCGGGQYKILIGDREDAGVKLDFAQAIIKSSLQDGKIAQINVEYTDSAIVTLKDALFAVDGKTEAGEN
jgi:Cell division septal protein